MNTANDMTTPTNQIFSEVRALIDRSRQNFVYAVNMEILHTVCGELERPNNAHGVCTIGATTTPTGLPLIARGAAAHCRCAYPRYPGNGSNKKINPNGVASLLEQSVLRGNPVGVEQSFSRLPGVARIRATPGCKRKPHWGCKAATRRRTPYKVNPQ